jgi:GNAT superfamily N-acetyltransferase
MIQFRDATSRDLYSLRRLVSALVTEVGGSDWKVERHLSLSRAIRSKEILIATKNNRIVGFVHGIIHEDIIDGGRNLFVTAQYVLPRHRRSKVGTGLLNALVREAIDKGVVEIETSTMSNQGRKFYEHYGFQQRDGEIFLELTVKHQSRLHNKL